MGFDYFVVVIEIGVEFVYFVDEDYLWNVVFVSLVLDSFGLWFNVGVCIQKSNSIIENMQ